MGGGLIQLKYLDSEADFFIGNPQISFFKTVFKSYANFSQELIDVNILSQKEKKWLNNYHKTVFQNLKYFMNNAEILELEKACSAI